jgi:hypothetical protein
MKSKNKSGEKKEIMRSHAPAPGAMVLSSSQQGNFGGYGNQYTMGGMGLPQQNPMGGMMGQPPAAPAAMHGYGGMQQQQPPQPYGQPAAPSQPYSQQSYGMQHQQQAQYGQPSSMQQQYGQPPPLQQPPFGF